MSQCLVWTSIVLIYISYGVKSLWFYFINSNINVLRYPVRLFTYTGSEVRLRDNQTPRGNILYHGEIITDYTKTYMHATKWNSYGSKSYHITLRHG